MAHKTLVNVRNELPESDEVSVRFNYEKFTWINSVILEATGYSKWSRICEIILGVSQTQQQSRRFNPQEHGGKFSSFCI